MHLFVNLSFALTKERWSPTIQTCLDKYYLPWEALSRWIGLKKKCCAGVLVFVVPYGAPLHVLCHLGMHELGLRHLLLHWETAVTFVPGLLLERDVVFRAGEELNPTVGHQQQKVSVSSDTMTALWGAAKQLYGSNSESEQRSPREGAEEPDRGLGFPQVSLASASVGNLAIYGV